MKKGNKKGITKGIIFLIGIGLVFFFIFIYAYSLGLNHRHNSFITQFLPVSVTKIDDEETEMVRKTIFIESTSNDETISIPSTISFPHSWYFDEIKLKNSNENILNGRKYVITSSDEKIVLTIIPKRVDNLRGVMSVTTVLSQEIQRRCLGSYDISESAETEFISLYRENIDNTNINYIQEVVSVANPKEDPVVLEEFLVFKRDGGFIAEEEFIWTAEISLKFDESVTNEQKEAYLNIVDEIVSSLQIK